MEHTVRIKDERLFNDGETPERASESRSDIPVPVIGTNIEGTVYTTT